MIPADRRPLLVLTGVSRSFGPTQALQPIDLTVTAGQCVAFLGVNGSGKSTLLRVADGRDTATAGQVRYDGQLLSEDALVARTEIAVVGDPASAYPDLTVREHLLMVAVAHGAGSGAAGLADAALAECRLADHAAARPGMAVQRAAAGPPAGGCAGAATAAVLILDEPEQRLGAKARQWLAGVLVREKARGAALLLATHHVELAEAVADEAIVLLDGAVIRREAPGRDHGGLR